MRLNSWPFERQKKDKGHNPPHPPWSRLKPEKRERKRLRENARKCLKKLGRLRRKKGVHWSLQSLIFHLGFKEFKVSSSFSSLGFLAKSLKCMLGFVNATKT